MLELAPWDETGLAILRACNTPEMTAFLGGPESEEKLLNRQQRYLAYTAEGTGAWAYRVLLEGVGIGSVNYWDDENAYEMGWAIAGEFQGRGLATAAIGLALDDAARRAGFDYVTACPGVDNVASNAVARSAGFELVGEQEIEYPAGQFMRANRWRFDLAQRQSGAN